jgi:hypothetical protein
MMNEQETASSVTRSTCDMPERSDADVALEFNGHFHHCSEQVRLL